MGMEEGGDSMQPPQTPRRTRGPTLFGLGLLTSFIQPIFLLFIGKDVNDAFGPMPTERSKQQCCCENILL